MKDVIKNLGLMPVGVGRARVATHRKGWQVRSMKLVHPLVFYSPHLHPRPPRRQPCSAHLLSLPSWPLPPLLSRSQLILCMFILILPNLKHELSASRPV